VLDAQLTKIIEATSDAERINAIAEALGTIGLVLDEMKAGTFEEEPATTLREWVAGFTELLRAHDLEPRLSYRAS
jgi:predicted component of type VI protein secretion system